MLFATDALNVVDRKLSERRHNKLKTLQFANTVFAMTRSHTFNKTLDEKTAYYFDLIRTGEAGVGTSKSHRLRLVTSGKEQVLRHVVLP
jgi:predicted nucleic acid-binding protein